jgi:intracellular sulfur oxidation DsrE/DsrF family protein
MSLYLLEDVIFMAELPSFFKVGSEVINHGDFVIVSDTVTATQESISVPVKSEVISSSVAIDYHTSITVAPLVNNDPNKQIGIEVISNGMAVTAVTTDNTSTPITFNQLPSNEYITVQTRVTDKTTGEVEVFQETPILTPNANIPVVDNSRDVTQDRAVIASPQNQVIVDGDTKSVNVSFDSVANWDPSKTSVSILVVGPGGASTSIGVGGDGGSVTVDNLGAVLGYTVKMVIRDLGSGEETIIDGGRI